MVAMEEKRGFFRIRNPGTIKAKYEKHDLYVIDISPSGAHIVAKDISIEKDGIIEILINHFAMKVNYELLKKHGEDNIVAFRSQREVDSLLSALKNIRNSMEVNPGPSQVDIIKLAENISAAHTPVPPKIENIIKLNSLYSIRLYEVIRQYVAVGDALMTVEDLREILGVAKLKTYKSYSALRRNIIEPAKIEINEKTDLTIIYTEIKEGNKVVAIRFTIMTIL